MTDKEIADRVYIELSRWVLLRGYCVERPDALLPTLGNQTGLNMAMELSKSGLLEELGVELLGTKLSAIGQSGRPGSLQAADGRAWPAHPKVRNCQYSGSSAGICG